MAGRCWRALRTFALRAGDAPSGDDNSAARAGDGDSCCHGNQFQTTATKYHSCPSAHLQESPLPTG